MNQGILVLDQRVIIWYVTCNNGTKRTYEWHDTRRWIDYCDKYQNIRVSLNAFKKRKRASMKAWLGLKKMGPTAKNFQGKTQKKIYLIYECILFHKAVGKFCQKHMIFQEAMMRNIYNIEGCRQWQYGLFIRW